MNIDEEVGNDYATKYVKLQVEGRSDRRVRETYTNRNKTGSSESHSYTDRIVQIRAAGGGFLCRLVGVLQLAMLTLPQLALSTQNESSAPSKTLDENADWPCCWW